MGIFSFFQIKYRFCFVLLIACKLCIGRLVVVVVVVVVVPVVIALFLHNWETTKN
jgi:hypothetical protein